MDVLDVLDALEQHVRGSPPVPLSDLRAVDGETVEELLRATRRGLERSQQEALSAQPRDILLNQAANEARLLIETARAEAREILRDDRIQARKRQRYEEIVGGGRQQANEVMRQAYGYSVERMSAVVRRLETLRKQVHEGLEIAQKTIKDAEKAQRQRRKETARKRARRRR